MGGQIHIRLKFRMAKNWTILMFLLILHLWCLFVRLSGHWCCMPRNLDQSCSGLVTICRLGIRN